MATEGTPYQGLDYIAAKVYTGALSLVAYTNAAGSLGDTSVYADLIQPTGGGYAAIALDGTWTISNGTVTYLKSSANPAWTATGSWSNTVRGVAIVDVANQKLVHFRDCAVAFTAANGRRLEVDLTNLVT